MGPEAGGAHPVELEHGSSGLDGGPLEVDDDVATDHRASEAAKVGLGGREVGGDEAVAQDRHLLGMGQDLVEVVADEDDRAPLGGQPADRLEQRAGLLGREDRGRLVEDEDARAVIQGAQDLDPLECPHRQARHPRVRVDAQAEARGELADDGPRAAPVEQPVATRLPADRQVLRHGERREQHEVLVDHRDPQPMGVGDAADLDRSAVEPDRARVAGDVAGKDLHEGRLAGPVLADDRVDAAGLELEVDPAQGPNPVVVLDDAVHRDGRGDREGRPDRFGSHVEVPACGATAGRGGR